MDYENRRVLEREYASLIKQKEEYIDSYNKAMKKFDDKLTKKKEEIMLNSKFLIDASTLELDFIGPFIAKLISFVEQENYIYKKGDCLTKHTYLKNYNDCNYSVEYDNCVVYLITKKSENSLIYEDDAKRNIDGKSVTNFKSLYPNTIELSRIKTIYQKDKKIKFYDLKEDKDSYLSVQRNVNLDDYSYVYDFINEIIKYRLDNNLDIHSEKVEEILETFINNYKNDNILARKKGV